MQIFFLLSFSLLKFVSKVSESKTVNDTERQIEKDAKKLLLDNSFYNNQ